MATRGDELDEEVLRQQPEKNSDGTPWKLKIGSRFLAKRDILDNWNSDKGLRRDVRKLLLGLKLHLLGHRPSD
jgi:hypothetical protein